jgi:polar amino acid transport system permease protein
MDLLDTFFNVPILIRTFPMLMSGLWITIQIGATSIIAGLVLGLFLSLIRLYAARPLVFIARIYIDIFRSIPLLVLLIVVYYALPFVGIRLSPFFSAVLALTLVSGAYTAEIFRAGIEAIPSGQFEASRASGPELSPHDGRCGSAAGGEDRDPAADQQLHQRHEGHGACLGGRDAGPA